MELYDTVALLTSFNQPYIVNKKLNVFDRDRAVCWFCKNTAFGGTEKDRDYYVRNGHSNDAGFLSAAIPEATVRTDVPLVSDGRRMEADLVIGHSQQKVLVEVRQSRRSREPQVERALQLVTRYLDVSGIKEAVIYFHPRNKNAEMSVEERDLPSLGGRVSVLTPLNSFFPSSSSPVIACRRC